MELLKLKRMPKMLQQAVICPSCGSLNFHSRGEELYCIECSLVIVRDTAPFF